MKTDNEILNFIKKKRKTLTKNTKSGYEWYRNIHVTITYVEEVDAWQVALHHIEGDVVMTLSEFWINENWEPLQLEERPPSMWYYP